MSDLYQKFVDSLWLRPTEPSHVVDMIVRIPKGASEGTALIPCAMETISHSIDINPSLVKGERCDKCGGKVPLAEIKETRYRSCPLVTIRLNAPATQELNVPITFGIYRWQVLSMIWVLPAIFPFMALFLVATASLSLLWGLGTAALGPLYFLWAPRKLRKWYKSVKPTLRPYPAEGGKQHTKRA